MFIGVCLPFLFGFFQGLSYPSAGRVPFGASRSATGPTSSSRDSCRSFEAGGGVGWGELRFEVPFPAGCLGAGGRCLLVFGLGDPQLGQLELGGKEKSVLQRKWWNNSILEKCIFGEGGELFLLFFILRHYVPKLMNWRCVFF